MASNCLGRAYILAEILQKDFEVEIIGPLYGKEVWPPCANSPAKRDPSARGKIKYKIFPGRSLPWLLFYLPSWLKKIDGDIIYASKFHLTSFGLGLLKKLFSGKKLILDIDDWEPGAFLSMPRRKRYKKAILNFFNPFSYCWIFLMSKLSFLADDTTVASNFLKKKYGGTIIPHGRNHLKLNPAKYSQDKAKQKLDLKSKKIVMFLGTPTLHKGILDLLEATKDINEIQVVIVGVDDNAFSLRIKKEYTHPKYIGMIPFSEVPEYLIAADIVIIPQRGDKLYSIAQTPAKVFDAMCLAKPIIATTVGDLPKILDGCGVIIEPAKTTLLKKAILDLIKNPTKAKSLGEKARLKCINKYSYQVLAKKIKPLFEKIR
ncbi:glycosyltransferase [Patescibacteria group bacterium]